MFEKGKSYTYEEIAKILDKTRDSVVEELYQDADERLSNSMTVMLFKMQSMLVLGLFQARLLCKEEK